MSSYPHAHVTNARSELLAI